MTKQTVEMHPAYVWDCDNCGGENFERAVVYEFTPEERRELAEQGEEPETGNWMTHPDHVKCRHCGAAFEAHHFQEGEQSRAEGEE
jgi:rubredoxin